VFIYYKSYTPDRLVEVTDGPIVTNHCILSSRISTGHYQSYLEALLNTNAAIDIPLSFRALSFVLDCSPIRHVRA